MAKQEKDKNIQRHFWKDFKAELKKVIWPTKKQLANNTMVVIAMVLVTTVVVLILDLAFEALNTYGINKVKETVQNSISGTVDKNENVSEDDNNHDEETGSENENQTSDENSENGNQTLDEASKEGNQASE